MKNSVKRLLEGSPTRFFDDIRARLDEKTSAIVESVASTVADTVFEEGKKADRDENKVVVSNKNIQKNIENKTPEKIKKLKGDLKEDAEQLDELSTATLGRYVKQASDSHRVHGSMGQYNRAAAKTYAKHGNADLAARTNANADENDRKVGNRRKGIRSAVDKLVHKANESVEPLEELSNATLGRYTKKAGEDSAYRAYHLGKKMVTNGLKNTKTPDESINKEDRKIVSRQKYTAKAVDKLVHKANEEVEPVAEDMGAHTISTKHGGKNGKSFQTFVVNKKRVSKEGSQRRWADMIKKATPSETVWDKHVKGNG